MKLTRFSIYAAATAIALTALPAAAQTSNDEIYQVVDTIHDELLAILGSTGKTPKASDAEYEVTERQPRHVLQEARELIHKIEEIHGHHGLPEIEEPPFPTHEVTPAEVMDYVELALEEIRELEPVFGVTSRPEPAPLPTGKTPTDIYRLLHVTSLQMDALGETELQPFHVYRVAMTIVHELDNVWDHVGLTGEVQLETHHGMGLEDVYDQAFGLMNDLSELVANNDRFAISGGVVPLNDHHGEATPADVMDIMNAVLADLGAVKVVVDSDEPVEFQLPTHSDVLPTNLYDAIVLARKMVESLKGVS